MCLTSILERNTERGPGADSQKTPQVSAVQGHKGEHRLAIGEAAVSLHCGLGREGQVWGRQGAQAWFGSLE